MFYSKQYDCHLDSNLDQKNFGTKFNLKKFDTNEFDCLPSQCKDTTVVANGQSENCVDVRDVAFYYDPYNPVLNKINLQVPTGMF